MQPPGRSSTPPAWHTLTFGDACRALDVQPGCGLAADEVERRRARYGANRIEARDVRPWWRLARTQFTDVMVLVLVGAALVAGLVGEPLDSAAILVIVLLNALVGFVQEWRAERAVAALRDLAAPVARVLRAEHEQHVPAEQLVPGDVVRLEAGQIVPADLRLGRAHQLEADESALTGESLPVAKHEQALEDPRLPLGDRAGMLFKGTLAVHGRGLGVVVATGMATELGRIAALLQRGRSPRTPLQRRLARFGRRLAVAVLGVCVVVFLAGLLREEPPLVLFLTAVSLAVAAVPEALPAVVTVALAQGARRMARRHALVRHLPAVETLGSVTTICADKTGTLTENRMVAEAFVVAGERRAALPDPQGADGAWSRLGLAIVLNTDARRDAAGDFMGDPTETGLLEAAAWADWELEGWTRWFELPFDATRKRMTTLHHTAGAEGAVVGAGCERAADGCLAVTKGAPEVVVPLCTREAAGGGERALDAAAVLARVEALAAEGCRVLAYAERRWSPRPERLDAASVESDLTLLGLAALADPPREGAAESIAACRRAGITPVMITGDHPGTARAIARRLGILADTQDASRVVTGPELARGASPVGVSVFARVTPEQKIDIVEALQTRGEVVAMTGDGVNDAPALRRADIGVAMGRRGTDVAREASAMMLLDDDFTTIVRAVREGRRIHDNVRKFLKYTMTSNAGEIWTLLLAPFLGLPLPLLPIQILWVNLVTDGLPGLALSAEPEERGVMGRPPRPPSESVFACGAWQHMLWCGLLIAALSLGAQAWALARGSPHWRTVVFSVLTLSQLVHALAVRCDRDSLLRNGPWRNRALVGALLLTVALQAAVIWVPALSAFLHTSPLPPAEIGVCLGLPWIVLLAVELDKARLRRRDRRLARVT